ncbi:MAG: hypothetical protein HC821_01115 [Lewinella sp.]|nr:hypothetical protein [Lewinella sp.]
MKKKLVYRGKNPLIAIYRSLDKPEQRALGKWLASPAHNQREDVLALHQYLLAGNHLYKTSALEKTRLWRRLFGNDDFDDARLRQTLHFALRATEEWLAFQHWQENQVQQKLALAAHYRRRKLDGPLERTLRQIEQLQTEFPFRNEDYFRNEYLLQLEHYTNLGTQLRTQKDVRLQAVADALDHAYLIEKLRHCCNMLFHQRVSSAPYETGLLDEAIRHIEARQLEKTPGLATYYFVIKAITAPDTEREAQYFEQLRSTVRQNGHLLPVPEQREVYLMAINLCIPKINSGIEAYSREAFEWYRLGIAAGILVENETLTRYTFLNATFLAIRLNELVWAEEFLEKYQSLLDEAHREQAYGFAKARLFYAKNDYSATMRLLSQMDFKDHAHNLFSKYMLLKMYYELEEFDALESLLDSLSAYLRRREIVENQKTNGQNIIRLARNLLRLDPYDRSKKEAYRQEVLNTQPLTERDWFLAMLEGRPKAAALNGGR